MTTALFLGWMAGILGIIAGVLCFHSAYRSRRYLMDYRKRTIRYIRAFAFFYLGVLYLLLVLQPEIARALPGFALPADYSSAWLRSGVIVILSTAIAYAAIES